MERYMDIFAKLAFVLLAVWVILAGLGYTTMPSLIRQVKTDNRRHRAGGLIWNTPVVSAPSAEDSLAWPAAQVM